ncbi:MAG: diacylglycerol kinase family lipid kinase [Chloroflexales bacterium]|nr:diacylglycerol kinase family lipid kinase [Chloroflexales bacterium]
MTIERQEQTHRVFVVLNPMAGCTAASDIRTALQQHFAEQTTGEEDVTAVVRSALARNFRFFVAAGGDGTVPEVAEALVHTTVSLGILPIGTSNVLARELEIPINLDEACALLSEPLSTIDIDAMQVGEKCFMPHIGLGVASLVIRETDRASKRRFGRLAYIWNTLRQLVGFEPQRFMLVVDGKRLRMRAAQVLIANGGVLGIAPLRWGPNIHPNDGRIDVCVVNARTILDYLSIAWHTVLRQHRRSRRLRYLSAQQSISVNVKRPLPIQADEEIIGHTPVQVRVVPHAVRVIVPPTGATTYEQSTQLENVEP